MVCKGEIIYMDKTSSIPKHIKAALSLHDNSLKNIYMQNNNLIMDFDPSGSLSCVETLVFINAKIIELDGIILEKTPSNKAIFCLNDSTKRLSDKLFETILEFICYEDIDGPNKYSNGVYKYTTIQMEDVQYTMPDNLGICSLCGIFVTDRTKNNRFRNVHAGIKVNGGWQCLECPKLIKPNRQNIEHFNLIKPKDK